jgi:anti-sigma regulatory factor (Ser/Thr protein kinase)
LIASELCSNAVQHAPGAPGSIMLRTWVEEDGVAVEVSDDGATLPPPAVIEPELPDPEAEQGRGLFLVHELADDVFSEILDGRSIVRALKRSVIVAQTPPD